MKNIIATIKTLFWANVTTAFITLVLSYLQNINSTDIIG